MYRIDRSANRIQPLRECSFGELGIRERAHLQEWIAREPDALGEELLVIQKEFAGFSDTNERLDLLALDKQGSLVIIENKLDDTGRDVTWQALKYASYCAGLSKADIRRISRISWTAPAKPRERRTGSANFSRRVISTRSHSIRGSAKGSSWLRLASARR